MCSKAKQKALFAKTRLQSILLRNTDTATDWNFAYFSGLDPKYYSNNLLVLHPNSKPVVFASTLEAKNLVGNKSLSLRSFASRKEVFGMLKKELPGKRIGVNYGGITPAFLKKIRRLLKGKKIVDVSSALEETRCVKTKEELSKIKTACKISEETLDCIPDLIKKCGSERSLAIELEHLAMKAGASGLAFPTIVASGRHANNPHYIIPSLQKIKRNAFLLVDFGCRFENYCSDISRTFVVGRATEKQKALYGIVFEAQRIAVNAIKPGLDAQKVFELAGGFVERAFGEQLEHSVGHGLGLQVHDFPFGFGKLSGTVLRENMVFTVEPAIYGKFGGIRIEDDIVVTKTGGKLLSGPAPKELMEI